MTDSGTKKSFCVLSDSHAASLIRGFRQVQDDFPDVKVIFFAGVNAEWHKLSVRDGMIVTSSDEMRRHWALSSRGQDVIPPDFDFFVVFGIGMHAAVLLRRYKRMQELRKEAEITSDSIYEILARKPGMIVLNAVRAITAQPIFLCPSPYQPAGFSKVAGELSLEVLRDMADKFNATCLRIAKEAHATFLPQPVETICENGATTKMEFWSGREKDAWHTNSEYGAIVARRILEASSSLRQ